MISSGPATSALAGPLRQSPTGELVVLQGLDLIRSQLQAIFLTRARVINGNTVLPGERLMRESFGCRAWQLLHANLTEETAALAESIYIEDLQRLAPGVAITAISTTLNQENQTLETTLQIQVPQLQQNLQLDVHLGPQGLSVPDATVAEQTQEGTS